ncbi:MAG TPA: FtsX-like permease family protein, partial [Longimicrobiales bacterium]|nr:FtsX-like permease family protein [Longimicrobiales bacterium]
GVEAVGLTSRVPLSLNNNGFGIYIDGHQSSPSDRPYGLDGAYVDEHYLDALGLPLLEGRGILPEDRDTGARVAVVTRTMAERFWPGESAVGREFRTDWDGAPTRIVGVVEDHRVDTPGESPKSYLLLPLRRGSLYANYVVRTTAPAAPLVPAMEAELRTLDPDLVFLETGTLQSLADVRLFPIRAGAWLIGIFGILALFLSAVGLYGVIGYAVSRRFREMGIRKALGAESASLVALVLRQGMIMVAVGFGVGAALAVAASRALSSVLFVSPLDPPSFAVAFVVLALVAVLANVVPARRASRVDPAVALKGP